MAENSNLRKLTEAAICAALATVLSLIKIEMPLGGSITIFSMVPIILFSFRHGVLWGTGAALVYSVINMLLGLGVMAYIPSPGGIALCILFDYIIAFTLLGIAGAAKMIPAKPVIQLEIGTFAVCLLRFACHVFVGAVVWYSITKAGQWNDYVNNFGMWTYSIIYNLQYMLPETVMAMAIAPALTRLAFPEKKR